MDSTAARTPLFAALADLVAVVTFVALGRRAHDEGSAVTGTLRIVAPFVIGLAVGWLVTRAWRRPLAVWETGVPVWVVTIAVGMLLRRTVFDRGIALPFVIVATSFVGAFLLGWRAIVAWLQGRRVRSLA